MVGEMALINGEVRTATVIADRDCTCLRLAVDEFSRLVADDPALLRPIASQIVARMRRSLLERAAPPPVGTITLVPLDTETEVGEAVELLRATLLSQVPDATSISPDGSDADITSLEVRHNLVVLVAEPGATPWTRQCLRQSDAVVLVASASSNARQREVEEVLGEHRDAIGTRVDLVLVQSGSGGDPSGTATWTRGRGIDRHHHLRRARAEDAARICRIAAQPGHRPRPERRRCARHGGDRRRPGPPGARDPHRRRGGHQCRGVGRRGRGQGLGLAAHRRRRSGPASPRASP